MRGKKLPETEVDQTKPVDSKPKFYVENQFFLKMKQLNAEILYTEKKLKELQAEKSKSLAGLKAEIDGEYYVRLQELGF